MDIDALNAAFGIAGTLIFAAGRGGLPMLQIDNGLATATISPYAGQVLTFRPAGATDDLLFVSERAYFAPGKEIKGGIPMCWPWFGPDPTANGRPLHGFARMQHWTVTDCTTCADGATRVRLALADNAATHAIWPQPFRLELDITVGATLSLALTTHNLDAAPMQITQGLHTYFKIGDATRLNITGLDGCRYIDKAAGADDAVIIQNGAVTVAGEVNRIYEQVPPTLHINDPVLGRRIRIASEHSRTCVVWNPWIETARMMDDLDDLDYQRFICVETVNTASEVIAIPPQGRAKIAATYQLETL